MEAPPPPDPGRRERGSYLGHLGRGLSRQGDQLLEEPLGDLQALLQALVLHRQVVDPLLGVRHSLRVGRDSERAPCLHQTPWNSMEGHPKALSLLRPASPPQAPLPPRPPGPPSPCPAEGVPVPLPAPESAASGPGSAGKGTTGRRVGGHRSHKCLLPAAHVLGKKDPKRAAHSSLLDSPLKQQAPTVATRLTPRVGPAEHVRAALQHLHRGPVLSPAGPAPWLPPSFGAPPFNRCSCNKHIFVSPGLQTPFSSTLGHFGVPLPASNLKAIPII